MTDSLLKHAQNIRKKIIETPNTRLSAHFGGSLSCADILTVLFGAVMNADPTKTSFPDRDRFILSKGHCALGLYAALNEFGFISDDELKSFNTDGGDFPTHCVRNPSKGIEISSGSLGLGLSVATGIALALKERSSPATVYVLAGNGEADEGSLWEAAMFSGANKLNNICLVIDDNGMQNDGSSEHVLNVKNWKERLDAFGWLAIETNGHNLSNLESAFKTPHPDAPLAIVAKTVKGKGVSFMENVGSWHHNKLTEEQFKQAALELGLQEI